MKKLLCTTVLFSLISLTADAENQMDTNKAITLEKNQTEFTIKLPSNPTTGYSWFLKSYDSSLVQPLEHEFIGPKESRIGAGGTEIWRFRPTQKAFQVPQFIQLTFVYAQPWNIKSAEEKVVTVVTHS